MGHDRRDAPANPGEAMNPYVRPSDSVPISRRSVMHAGLAALALTGLSACTNYGAQAPASSAPPSGGAGGVSAATADIPVGGGKIFPDAETVITQPTSGRFKAFSSICTHANCPVAAVTTTIDCNCHGSKYSITDGSVVNGPATRPLPAKTAKVQGNSVVVSA
jgi:Rieske Fe-S protein